MDVPAKGRKKKETKEKEALASSSEFVAPRNQPHQRPAHACFKPVAGTERTVSPEQGSVGHASNASIPRLRASPFRMDILGRPVRSWRANSPAERCIETGDRRLVRRDFLSGCVIQGAEQGHLPRPQCLSAAGVSPTAPAGDVPQVPPAAGGAPVTGAQCSKNTLLRTVFLWQPPPPRSPTVAQERGSIRAG